MFERLSQSSKAFKYEECYPNGIMKLEGVSLSQCKIFTSKEEGH